MTLNRPLDRTLVHKAKDQNVLISNIECVARGETDEYLATFQIDPAHDFFFEHPQDHVPGLMLIEAGRQYGIAVSHLFHGVPQEEKVFVLKDMRVTFGQFAELGVPLQGRGFVSQKKLNRRGELEQMVFAGHFIQNGVELGHMQGTWMILNRKVMERIRKAAGKPQVRQMEAA